MRIGNERVLAKAAARSEGVNDGRYRNQRLSYPQRPALVKKFQTRG